MYMMYEDVCLLLLFGLTCRGVNMYAMLTGCLPYTVEPFNITALHAKMLENKMNPIPSTLSGGEYIHYNLYDCTI